MTRQWWGRAVSLAGLVLVTVGVGFAVDPGPPFVPAGLIVGAVGLVCLLVPGWIDFTRKSRW